MPNVWRGVISLSLAVGFEEDKARLGLPAAVERLRDAMRRIALQSLLAH
jgi:hypothetical protein